VIHFLLVYDRSAGQLLERQAFPQERAGEALRARFDCERRYADRPSIEVVVIGAESEEGLRRTHASYFATPSELVEQMRAVS
jgi:hypothetical protein